MLLLGLLLLSLLSLLLWRILAGGNLRLLCLLLLRLYGLRGKLLLLLLGRVLGLGLLGERLVRLLCGGDKEATTASQKSSVTHTRNRSITRKITGWGEHVPRAG